MVEIVDAKRFTLDEYDYVIRQRAEFHYIRDDRGDVVGIKERIVTVSLTVRSAELSFGFKRLHSEAGTDVWIGFLPLIALHWRVRLSWKSVL